jgi:hypothetical protein
MNHPLKYPLLVVNLLALVALLAVIYLDLIELKRTMTIHQHHSPVTCPHVRGATGRVKLAILSVITGERVIAQDGPFRGRTTSKK